MSNSAEFKYARHIGEVVYTSSTRLSDGRFSESEINLRKNQMIEEYFTKIDPFHQLEVDEIRIKKYELENGFNKGFQSNHTPRV